MNRGWMLAVAAQTILLAFFQGGAEAFPRYRETATSGNCVACHGRFFDAMSPKGTVFPEGNKHQMHRDSAYMDTTCDLCHTDGDGRNPWIGSSNGTPLNVGYGCVGCHGRQGDAGQVPGEISPGRGAGLRQHHTNSGVTLCMGCHDDGDPQTYTPVAESSIPAYYGTVPDTLAAEPCNAVALHNSNENWSIGDFEGVDNDGDGVYDGADTDCPEILIDGFESGGASGWSTTVPWSCPTPVCQGQSSAPAGRQASP